MHTALAIACLLGGLSLYGHAMVKDGIFLLRTEIYTGWVMTIAGGVAGLAILFGLL